MRAAVLATLALLLGCRAPVTQLVGVVDGDLDPADRASIVIEVSGAGPRAVAAPSLPFSFGIHPRGEPPLGVRVHVRALRADGTVTVEQSAAVSFAQHETRRVSLSLARACRFVWGTCRDGDTCRDGACVSEAIPLDELPVVEPGRELDDAGSL